MLLGCPPLLTLSDLALLQWMGKQPGLWGGLRAQLRDRQLNYRWERRCCSQVPPPQSSTSPGPLVQGSMTWVTESIKMEKTAAWEEGQLRLMATILVSSPSLGGFQQC